MCNLNYLKVEEVAKKLGVGPQLIRVGLQRGTLPFGWAVFTGKQYRYIIPRPLFEEKTGIKWEE